jgi:surface polysaccharide O-acyltransferase-like enzyme
MSIPDPKVRQSNFELLRIIAMFMVLILHADFQALGAPDKAELIKFPLAATIKVIFEMACIVAVNVFVLISGWFGIRPSVKGISKFIFQCQTVFRPAVKMGFLFWKIISRMASRMFCNGKKILR